MADDAQDTQTADDILPQVKSAIEARSSYFLDQADSLTFEKVRRLLEKDLGLEAHALDVHKRLVKQWLKSCVVPETSDLPKSQADAGEIAVISTDEAPPIDELQVKNEVEETHSGGDETMEDSPVMGLMTGPKKAKINVDAEDTESKPVPSEITIKKAIWARASYLKENSESITMGGLRRLLEEDLKVEKHSLDPFKKFVGQQVDEALNSTDVSLSTASEKKNSKDSHKKAAAKSSKEETPTSSGNESDEEEEVKVKKRSASKRKPQKTEAVKKRKKSEVDVKGAKQKQSKPSKSIAEGSGEEDAGDVSENDNSDSSAEKPVKKEVPKPAYGKQVERLRSVIKSCGLSISPAIYKKVKQAPENKREAYLKKELEEILAKEGLSSNPSEKEIKDVKKRKERAKELEGIDLSNIVSSGRRRSTTSFIPPPKPDIPDISESESESDDDEDEEEEAVEEVENEEANEDQENGDKTDDGSHNEESDKGNSDSD